MIPQLRNLIIVAACVAIALVAISAMGLPLPGFVVTILWIVLVALIALVAIRFLSANA